MDWNIAFGFGFVWWGIVIFTLTVTFITIMAVTIFLHRSQAHRAVRLHPGVEHFFRFWLWLTTGMGTKDWVAVHRKHHAKCETAEDPHSPQTRGLRTVLGQGTELYRAEAKNKETLEKYGSGTPDDWLERRLYTPYSTAGIWLMFLIDIILFGPSGIIVWAMQMMWIPVSAAGVINGIGHFWGYRGFQTYDASTNIVPWGILIGGEELHNNHHAYPTSAKFSQRRFEIDVGWYVICLLEKLGLAKVKRIAPPLVFRNNHPLCDEATVQALQAHRPRVLAELSRAFRKVYREEMRKLRKKRKQLMLVKLKPQLIRAWFYGRKGHIDLSEAPPVAEAIKNSQRLQTFHQLRQGLEDVASLRVQEEAIRSLELWCAQATTSGITQVKHFAETLRGYALKKQSV